MSLIVMIPHCLRIPTNAVTQKGSHNELYFVARIASWSSCVSMLHIATLNCDLVNVVL